MKKNNVKIIWEYGIGLGQINTLVSIAKNLETRNWNVEFFIPSVKPYIKDIERLLDNNNLKHTQNPGSPTIIKGEYFDSQLSSLLGLCGLQDSCAFTFTLRSWLSVLDETKPNLVITSSSIGGLMAANLLGIPTVNIEHGFFTPEDALSPIFFSDELKEINKNPNKHKLEKEANNKLLNIVNNARNKLNAQPLESLQHLFSASRTYWLNYPELTPLKHRKHTIFSGKPICSNNGLTANWPLNSVNKTKVFVYLYAGSPRVNFILESLASDPNLNILVHMLGLSKNHINHFSRRNMTISSNPLDITSVLNQVDVVVCHGGSNLITESMLKGKPLVLDPVNTLQHLNSRRVVEQGAGIKLPKELNAELIQAYIKKASKSQFQHTQSNKFSYINSPLQIEVLTNEIEQLSNSSTPVSWEEKLQLNRPNKLANFSDYDVVFLSYDEPNADANWENLKKIAPKAKRVHGVKGFDAAHKAAGQAAETERFILVDADNQIDPDFLKISINVPAHLEHSVWQWCSINHVTGLVYAFGGVKIWTKEVIEEMRTHESCEDESNPLSIDFWNQPSYQVFHGVHSINYTNGSPFQAFRSGFREAIKLGRLNGSINTVEQLKWHANNPEIRRMAVWMSAGADVENGYWSLLGARCGFLSYFCNEFSFKVINEYQLVAEIWQTLISDILTKEELLKTQNATKACVIDKPELREKVKQMGDKIRNVISHPPILDMSAKESIQFKQAMKNNIKPSALFTPVFTSREL